MTETLANPSRVGALFARSVAVRWISSYSPGEEDTNNVLNIYLIVVHYQEKYKHRHH